LVARAALIALSGGLVTALILFLAAGRLDWDMAWVYVGLHVLHTLLTMFLIDPELVAERSGIKPGTKRWDIPLALLVGRLGPVAMLIVAGLDVRLCWSRVPKAVEIAGLIVMLAGMALSTWAITANRFFASVVRIQSERGHTAVSTGPYRTVRHPGYAAWMLVLPGSALMLGSWWVLIPAGLTMLVLIVRTALEDRTLLAELPGYQEYAQQTRYRLLPGVW
jgi:protein-S-isoprenylcysteine O-methyltransferase Ste14